MVVTVSPEAADAPARVEFAKIVRVNAAQFTVDVLTQFTHREYLDMPFASTFTHRDHAGGIHIMPEVDSYCYVFTPGDMSGAFVLGFVINPETKEREAVFEDDSINPGTGDEPVDFIGMRDPLEPGDIMLATADENKIVLRRGGIIQIGSTSLSQRLYMPIQNIIRDYFQRYEGISPLGEISWGHAELVDNEDPNLSGTTGETPVLVKYSIKETAQEDVSTGKYTIEVRAGRLTSKPPEGVDEKERLKYEVLDTGTDGEHIFANAGLREQPGLAMPSEDNGVVSVTIYSHASQKVTYAFQLDREGNNFIKSEANIHVEVAKSVYVKAKEGVKIDFGDEGYEDEENQESIDKTFFLQLTKDNQFIAEVKKIIYNVLNEVKVSAQDITLDGKGVTTIKGKTVVIDAENLSLKASGGMAVGAAGMGFGPPGMVPGDDAGKPVVIDNGLLAALIAHRHELHFGAGADITIGMDPGVPATFGQITGYTGVSGELQVIAPDQMDKLYLEGYLNQGPGGMPDPVAMAAVLEVGQCAAGIKSAPKQKDEDEA